MLLSLSLLDFCEVKDEQILVSIFTEIHIIARTIQAGLMISIFIYRGQTLYIYFLLHHHHHHIDGQE